MRFAVWFKRLGCEMGHQNNIMKIGEISVVFILILILSAHTFAANKVNIRIQEKESVKSHKN